VGDLGCGTGELTATLAPFVARVIAVDQSRAMLAAARARLRDHANVELRHGDLEALPVADGELDAAVLLLVLPYVAEPAQANAEASRVLKPAGRLLVVDLTPHAREDYRQTMGHLWQGFSEEQMNRWLAQAGLEAPRYRTLPPDARAKGPALFCATARRPARPARGAVRPGAGAAQFQHQKRDSHLRIRG
jgi:ArsR family transcriptional regulator